MINLLIKPLDPKFYLLDNIFIWYEEALKLLNHQEDLVIEKIFFTNLTFFYFKVVLSTTFQSTRLC